MPTEITPDRHTSKSGRLSAPPRPVYSLKSLVVYVLGLVCFTENPAILPLQHNPGHQEPNVLGVAAERNCDRVADGNARRQADVVICSTGTRHEPVPTFSQHARGPRLNSRDVY